MTPNDLQSYVEHIIEEHNIPAASIAVWKDAELYKAAAGCLNVDTGVAVNTQLQLPVISEISKTSMGLGWMLGTHSASGQQWVSHNGATNGQCASLRIFPKQQACYAILLNRCKIDALTSINNKLTELIAGVDLTPSANQAGVTLSPDELQLVRTHF